jgi:hypothetical protein
MKKAAILQSNYIPWKGYFDIINSVETFIVYDEMQYTKNDWRNRNKIKTVNGLKWLTIAVVGTKFGLKINETLASDPQWNINHWNTIKMAYSKAPYFNEYKAAFESLYLQELNGKSNLSEINVTIIKFINGLLNIKTEVLLDRDLKLIDGKSERLVDLCKKVNADIYLSGPAAKDYLDESLFNAENIEVQWMDYSAYKVYEQQHPPFEHGVSIIDLLFNTGQDAPKYMKSFNVDEK